MQFAAHASLAFWNALPAPQRARTLALDRFASFPLREQNGRYSEDREKKEYRRETCVAVVGGALLRNASPAWHQFLREGLRLPEEQIIFAQLQSRLMVNMAGGVMENAGLCLDRFGLPYIPGSAVKGCARRMAIQSLLEAREAAKPAEQLARLLADIALVFGWGAQDWKADQDKDRHLRSDFVYAIGEARWQEVGAAARKLLPDTDHFAGGVSFLPAYPLKVGAEGLPPTEPDLGALELDVVTCHHREYYGGNPDYASAPDIEEPNPVVFPAVAPGHVFVFAVMALRRGTMGRLCDGPVWATSGGQNLASPPVQQRPESETPESGRSRVCPTALAREWLRQGLEIFGLGAKTAAGYGWFETSQTFQDTCHKRIQSERDKAARADLEPDPDWQARFKAMPEEQRRAFINKFAFDDEKWLPTNGPEADEEVQFSLIHFLLKVEPEFLAADRTKRSSKVAKTIAILSKKFCVPRAS